MKLIEDSCLLAEAGQVHPLSFLLPITLRLRLISLMVILAPQGETSCVCECVCWCGTYCQNPCRQTHGQSAAKLYVGYELAKT